MSSAAAAPSWYTWFKLAVFALLACNAAVFSVAGTPSEGIDAIAWLTLLALFELETAHRDRWFSGHAATAIRTLRLTAAAAVIFAAARYVQERAWLVAFVAIEINVLSGAPGRTTR